MEIQLKEGQVGLEVVGESHYQDNLWRLVEHRSSSDNLVRVDVYAVLLAEKDNRYDSNAVSLWVQGLKVGHLSRENARLYRLGLLALEQKYGKSIALPGVIAGGGRNKDKRGRLRLLLRHNPEDFGLPPVPSSSPPQSRIRTGLSDALATDGADGPYDLRWMNDLPGDDIGAIMMLRQLLDRTKEPIDRHFMHAHLEALLYRSRDASPSALDEYDRACRQHDSEMDGIRGAFLAKWGQIPLLETYKQMAIRQYKAKNFDQALWWAERGIAVYGDDAARLEAVEDLRKRVDAYRAKLQSKPG